MKKTMNLLAMAAAIVVPSAFTACSSNALVNEAPEQEQQKVTLNVTATQGTRTPDTRLAYNDPDDGTGVEVFWDEDETLGVVSYDGTSVPTIALSDPQLSGQGDGTSNKLDFSGTVNASSGDMVDRYNFYYPAQDGNPFITSGIDDTSGKAFVKMDYSTQGFFVDDPYYYLSWFNLMYTEKADDPSKGIALKHAAAMLRIKLTLPAEAEAAGSLRLSTWKPVFKQKAVLYYDAAGNVELKYEGETSMLTTVINNDAETGAARPLTVYMLVPEVTDFKDLLCKVSIVDDAGKVFSHVYNLTEDDSNTDNDQLLPEKVYTFNASLQEDRWAGSNIYWDETNRKPTFDEPYKMGKSAAQGLYFKWGSLVGVSPVGEWVDGETPVYSMTAKGTAATWGSIIPNGDGYDLSGDTEDICTAINSSWRMPSEGELRTLIESFVPIGERTASTGANDAGTGTIYNGELYGSQTYLPFSAYRRSSDGALRGGAGKEAYYWSKTSNASDGVCLEDWEGPTINYLSTGYALPIRCIKAN